MSEIELTPQQEEEARRIEDVMRGAATLEFRRMARLLASRENRNLFGETEFLLRDAMHRIGAKGLDAALSERKKRDTKGRASSAPTATKTPVSSATGPAESRPCSEKQCTNGRMITVRTAIRGSVRPTANWPWFTSRLPEPAK